MAVKTSATDAGIGDVELALYHRKLVRIRRGTDAHEPPWCSAADDIDIDDLETATHAQARALWNHNTIMFAQWDRKIVG